MIAMIQKIARLFKPERMPFHGKADMAALKYEFTIDGERYYSYRSVLSLSVARGIAAQMYYAEAEMRITRELLEAALAALRKALDGNKLTDASKIVIDLQDRLKWLFDPDTVYKLASVFFISENEDPTDFDYDFAKEKVAKFKKLKKKEFFSMIRLNEIMPNLNLLGEDLEIYMSGADAETRATMEFILPYLCRESTTRELANYIQSQVEILRSSAT